MALSFTAIQETEKNKIRTKFPADTVKILLSVSKGIYFVYFQTLWSLVRGCSGSLLEKNNKIKQYLAILQVWYKKFQDKNKFI